MNPYHKIQTVWARDPETKFKTLIEGEWALPEFGYLADCLWRFTEKVDGTNIRIIIDEHGFRVGGKTDTAQIPAFLLPALNEIGARAPEEETMTLYGEGYGAKIQKGGGNYKADGADFVLFDVWCGGMWLENENVWDIADKLNVDVVPVVGVGTLSDAVKTTREGFTSLWGDFPAEGLVMRPEVELQTRRGERIITKIKAKDFS